RHTAQQGAVFGYQLFRHPGGQRSVTARAAKFDLHFQFVAGHAARLPSRRPACCSPFYPFVPSASSRTAAAVPSVAAGPPEEGEDRQDGRRPPPNVVRKRIVGTWNSATGGRNGGTSLVWDQDSIRRVQGALRRWHDTHEARLPRRETDARIPVEPVYTPAHVADMDFERDLGWPGEYPYTRGPYATMYRGRVWTMRQYAGFGTPAEANRRFHYLLEQGTTGLSVAFDLPTQMGYDSDHPLAE